MYAVSEALCPGSGSATKRINQPGQSRLGSRIAGDAFKLVKSIEMCANLFMAKHFSGCNLGLAHGEKRK